MSGDEMGEPFGWSGKLLRVDLAAGKTSTIETMGTAAMGLHTLSGGMLFGEKLFLESEDGRTIDLGSVGRVTGVNSQLLGLLCEMEMISQ